MKIKIYQADAFSDKLFGGNPAAVCPLDNWLRDEVLQNIAMENNLAETAFYVKNGNRYEIRWFTPAVEVDLCGHATLASAFVLFNLEGFKGSQIEFYSPRSGKLTVAKNGDLLTLDFPADNVTKVPLNEELLLCFDIKPIEAYRGKTDYMLVFENEGQIQSIKPALKDIAQVKARGIIITAKGKDADFVSRFFAPQSGVDEDPVTGSAHTTLTPFWYGQTGKKIMKAIQLSPRKGYLTCAYEGERVKISGNARLYLRGEIEVEQ